MGGGFGKKQSWRNLKYYHEIFPEKIKKKKTNRSLGNLCLSYDSECWVEAAHPEGRGLWCASLIYAGSRVFFVFFFEAGQYTALVTAVIWCDIVCGHTWLTDWLTGSPPVKLIMKHLDICMYCSHSVYEKPVDEFSLTKDILLMVSICEPIFAQAHYFLFQSHRCSRRLFQAVTGSSYLVGCAEYGEIPERSAQKQQHRSVCVIVLLALLRNSLCFSEC